MLLWWLDDPSLLSNSAEAAIRDLDNIVLVSAATVWENVIKKALNKLDVPDDLDQAILECGFKTLPVSVRHALAVGSLPLLHRDPFDRMIIAQAMTEGSSVVSRDAFVLRYPIANIEA